MKQIINILIIIIFFLFQSSCSAIWDPNPKGWNWGLRPRPAIGIRNFPPADTEYGKGFKDGCIAAWGAITKGVIGDATKAQYNYDRMKRNPDYNTGWFDGLEQCTYINDWDVV